MTLTSRAFPERQALTYAAARRQPLALSLGQLVALEDVPDRTTRQGWDELVRSRALVLDEMAFRHRLASDLANFTPINVGGCGSRRPAATSSSGSC